MTDAQNPPPPSGAPGPARPAHRFGAPREAAVPRMETVRVTAPDLKRRAAMEQTRSRLVFAALRLRAAVPRGGRGSSPDATIIQPLAPHRPEQADRRAGRGTEPKEAGRAVQRAMITDRNGEILAISLPTAALYANPREMIDTGRRGAQAEAGAAPP